MKLNIENKVALVTGGGRDIGNLISLSLASENVAIAVNYHSSSKEADDTVSKIIKLGGRAKAYKGDVSNYSEMERMIVSINQDFGGIDFLINNAGYTRVEKFTSSEPEEWDKQIDICLKGFCMKVSSEREKWFFLVFSFLRHPCAKILLSLDRH